MSGTTLCIIDMQTKFWGCKTAIISKVIHEIKKASRRKDPIIVVEYVSFGSTVKKIMEAIKKSGCDYTIVTKHNDDGGDEIAEACIKNGFFTPRYRLVGLYRSACVKETAKGMAWRGSHMPDNIKIQISLFATTDEPFMRDKETEIELKYISEVYHNIKVI